MKHTMEFKDVNECKKWLAEAFNTSGEREAENLFQFLRGNAYVSTKGPVVYDDNGEEIGYIVNRFVEAVNYYDAFYDGNQGETIEALTAQDALEIAAEGAGEGFEDIDETTWVKVEVRNNDEDKKDDTAEKTVAVDPQEPDCVDGHSHEWESPYSVLGGLEQNPGVWGNGGGVIIRRVCKHCGCFEITNTWATNPETGEQGLDSVSYEEPNEKSLAYVEENKEEEVES